MDDIDRAQAREEAVRDEALAEFRRRRPVASRPAATHCDECGEPIPEMRRLAVPGCRRCVDCQAYFEMIAETGG